MDDRELLELAAKAAGYSEPNWPPRYEWNPLTDDGDALRLAVELNLFVQPHKKAVFVCDVEGNQLAYSSYQRGKDAATRRAIVRAAAEIGKEMNRG